ncbi:conjugal transfer protein TraB, partial [Acidithiobacillus sp. GGI-221]
QFPNLFSTLMDNAMASMALEHDDTLLIGADDLANKQDDYTDSLNIMGRYQGRISARQPAPFGEWRPWGRHTALASWWHFGGYRIGKETIAWAICYEQMLVWPIAWNFLMDHHKPSVLLAPSDHDWARGVLEPAVQKQAIHAWARLYHIPVLYANDAPPASHPSRRNHLAKHG